VLDVADRSSPLTDEMLLDDETSREVYAAFQHLSPACQQLLQLLTAEPRLDYATIGQVIGRPVGSIGPTRARCIANLRRLLEHSHNTDTVS
jgi:DNA-directed RNA polymerase specialized sigma24 family protein